MALGTEGNVAGWTENEAELFAGGGIEILNFAELADLFRLPTLLLVTLFAILFAIKLLPPMETLPALAFLFALSLALLVITILALEVLRLAFLFTLTVVLTTGAIFFFSKPVFD